MDQLFLGGSTARQAIHPNLLLVHARVGTRTYRLITYYGIESIYFISKKRRAGFQTC